MLKLISVIIFLNMFCCKENLNTSYLEKKETKYKTDDSEKSVKDSILHKTSKTCGSSKYSIGLSLSKQNIILEKDGYIFNIPSSKLIEELSDKEMVSDFWIDCHCISNGLKINYEFDLYHYKHKSNLHFVYFKGKEIFITKALRFYSDRNQENLLGLNFENPIGYSYDAVNENTLLELIKFENFQDENYNQNINDYFNDFKKHFESKSFNQLKLKGDTIVLKQSLKNVTIRNAITKYNDIAYYLEQSGLYKEAIYLLEKVIENFPDRTVAYINLGDAYWGLGKKEHAKKAYLVYVEQMTSKNKKEKIPKRVVERTK